MIPSQHPVVEPDGQMWDLQLIMRNFGQLLETPPEFIRQDSGSPALKRRQRKIGFNLEGRERLANLFKGINTPSSLCDFKLAKRVRAQIAIAPQLRRGLGTVENQQPRPIGEQG